jgi:hypothetical protein
MRLSQILAVKDLEKETIAVDLDGTLAKYTTWKGDTIIGPPVPGMVAKIKTAIAAGKNVVVFTARVAEDKSGKIKKAIQDWCLKYIGVKLEVTAIKSPAFTEFWDDRAKEVEKNKGEFVAEDGDTPSANAKAKVHGLPLTIEVKKNNYRVLHDDKGNVVYRKLMLHDYGFIDKTKGRDGDEVDVFVGPIGDKAKEVFVIHMKDMGPVKNEREDEDKCFIGFPSADAAKAAFLAHYPANFYESMTAMPVDLFKKKMKQASRPYTNTKIHARAALKSLCAAIRLAASKRHL